MSVVKTFFRYSEQKIDFFFNLQNLKTACIMMRNRFIINLIRQKAILRVFEIKDFVLRMISHFLCKSCMDVYGCALSSMVGKHRID